MKSNQVHILTLLAAILAFVPLIGVDYVLDSYVRQRATIRAQAAVDQVASEAQAAIYYGIGAVKRVLVNSPSLCTPTFIGNAQQAIQSSLYVRQILVENTDKVQYCAAFGDHTVYAENSNALSIPGRAETIGLVSMAGFDYPTLKVTLPLGSMRKISAFVHIGKQTVFEDMLPGSMARVVLTDGTKVAAFGDRSAFLRRSDDAAFVIANSFAGDVPLRVEMAVPFAAARAGYAELDVVITIGTCILSGLLLAFALSYVRRSSLPAFDLERAISAGELHPYYQPVINLTTGRLAGCEVLIRWVKSNGEVIPAGAFIDYAEITGLALPMTFNLMQQVEADLSSLCTDLPDLKIAINLFEGHFRDGTIIDDVQAIFGQSCINYRQLVFEITERRPLDLAGPAQSVIAGLHALGARLAMDDAGTGHSNLAYMQMLGVDIIKIDRMFVEMVQEGIDRLPVLDGLITMARELGTEIVAEGVATEEQALYLRKRGVHLAQGFLFAAALAPERFTELAYALNGAPKTTAPATADAA